MKKTILICFGYIFFSIGIIGIFIPLLPTTPFLLLAAGCFLRSSDRLYQWITHHRYFGQYISCYLKFRAVSLKTKIFSILLLWFSICFSIIFFVPHLWLKILLLIIAGGVTVHISSLRTLTKEMINQLNTENKKENRSL
ncbi:MAG: YbaN family protein [Spirochaetes bacterium]|nr:YbaN family protein [Spirochaetota bacterium]